MITFAPAAGEMGISQQKLIYELIFVSQRVKQSTHLRFAVGAQGPRGERATGSAAIEFAAIKTAAGYHVAKEDENAAVSQ